MLKLPSKPPEPMLTMLEAAAACRVSYRTIQNWIKDGKIEYRRWGRTVRIPEGAIYGKTGQGRRHDLSAQG